jgi:transmembrane sensor
MNPQANLFYRYLNNECTPEEVKALLKQFGQEYDQKELKALILQELEKTEIPEGFEDQTDIIEVFNQTDSYLQEQLFSEKKQVSISRLTWLAIAASIAICCTLGYLFFPTHQREVLSAQAINGGTDAKPGADKAILKLANGTAIVLNDNTKSTILNEAGLKITKTKDGMLVYEAAVVPSAGSKLVYNELITPLGAKYKIILPDGTRVWLNAGSSLRYPMAFDTKERRVELKGEGYFEVQKVNSGIGKVPFYVETPTQIVQVLGTEFNISAYDDDQVVKTTLISGKVNVSDRSNNLQETLNPGEQAVQINGGAFKVTKVNAESSISWKNGNFMFEDMYLRDIMKQLCRWYNVEIDESQIPQTRYNIFISRNETLQSVLNMLGSTGNLKFQLNNNRIKITR